MCRGLVPIDKGRLFSFFWKINWRKVINKYIMRILRENVHLLKKNDGTNNAIVNALE